MRPPAEESSTRVAVNRLKTLVVLLASAVLVVLALGVSALDVRHRPSPAEIAAGEFVVAVAEGDCRLAQMLLTEARRSAPGTPSSCPTAAPRRPSQVRHLETARRSGTAAVVLVQLYGQGEDWRAVGVTYERGTGRWQVERETVECLDPPAWQAPASCLTWSWP